MKRRDFFRKTSIAAAGLSISPSLFASGEDISTAWTDNTLKKEAKNIIFLVSDGMSAGTLTLADFYMRNTFNKHSVWVENYKNGNFRRAMMDTASANSLVTDSAAGGSAWGGGVRVPNNALNVGANGEHYTPILQKFKKEGKKVGCVTTVAITHATPASFCVNNISRSNQDEIAEQYLKLRFDVMLGGGDKYFSRDNNLYQRFLNAGFDVVKTKNDLQNTIDSDQPLLGVFAHDDLPYAIDHAHHEKWKKEIPTLAEMTSTAIDKLKNNPDGFVLQVEGGKVDWAAHANDAAGLIFDQLAFDEAVKVAMDFAIEDKNTLVIVTTDHGNANPGLFAGKNVNHNFSRFQRMKKSNTLVIEEMKTCINPSQVIELIEQTQDYVITVQEAKALFSHIDRLSENELEDYYKLPFEKLAQIQKQYTNVGFGDMDHSADFVECSAYGPGSELLPPFILNTFLHNMMLEACGVRI